MTVPKRASTCWLTTTAEFEAEATALSSLAMRQARTGSIPVPTETSIDEPGCETTNKTAQSAIRK